MKPYTTADMRRDLADNAERARAAHPDRDTLAPRLRGALIAEVERLSRSDGLHQYDGGIHRMPGCEACSMLARLRAALSAAPVAEEGPGGLDALRSVIAEAIKDLREGADEVALDGLIAVYEEFWPASRLEAREPTT